MITLRQICDLVALQGIVDSYQLSQQLQVSPKLVHALLEQLVTMHKIERVTTQKQCGSGQCKSCPSNIDCTTQLYRLSN